MHAQACSLASDLETDIAHLLPSSGTQLLEWYIIMAATILALLSPVLVIFALQHWSVRGLVDTAK